MLAPRASNAFVCARCELQLARRRLPTFLRRPSHANFSASTHRRDNADNPETLSESQALEHGFKITREVVPLNKVKKIRQGKYVRETSAQLNGVKTLGDDADILVLRDVRDRKPEDTPVEYAPAEPVVVPDILASLQQQRKDLTPEDIRDQLESLRPQVHAEPGEPLYVPLQTFVKLMRDLNSGFTQQQLSQFYSAAKNVEQENYQTELLASLKEGKGSAKRPVIRSSWQPGTSPISKRLPGVDISTRNKRAPVSKQLLVDRIIRELWKLVPLEEVEQPGEIELSLKPWQSIMLNAGEDETLLDRISNARKVKIQVYPQHSVLRITADKTTAEYAADDIEEALRNVHSQKLRLKNWANVLDKAKLPADNKLVTLFTDDDFNLITSLLGASVQRMDHANTMVIKALDRSIAEEAERMLIRLLPWKDHALYTLDSDALAARKTLGQLLPTAHDEMALEYRHRNATLGRWVFPVAKQRRVDDVDEEATADSAGGAPDEATTSKRRSTSVFKNLRQALKKGADKTLKRGERETPGDWTPFAEVRLSALFGRALFPVKDTQTHEELPRQPMFTSNVPGLASLLGSAHLHEAAASEHFQAPPRPGAHILVYEFVPLPQQNGLEAGVAPPNLRIKIRTSEDGTKAVPRDMYITFQQQVHTVLLPDKTADLQFSVEGRIQSTQAWRHVPSVLAWFEAVTANIASGDRLSAPNVTLDVPRWILPRQDAKTNGVQSVTYTFSNLHFRQSIPGEFEGTAMSCYTYQSGKMGARGVALGMYYKPDAQSVRGLLQDEEQVALFVDKSLRFVDRITDTANQTQPLARMLKPRKQMTARKQRRLEEQAAIAMANENLGEEATGAKGGAKINAIDDELMGLLDDAVEESQSQKDSETGVKPEGTDIHDTILARDADQSSAADDDDIMGLLDDAVKQSQDQKRVQTGTDADETAIDDTIEDAEQSAAAKKESVTDFSQQTTDITLPPSSEADEQNAEETTEQNAEKTASQSKSQG